MTAVLFKVVLGPPFTRCACGVELAGIRCWRWHEHKGFVYGCRNCIFQNARIEVAS